MRAFITRSCTHTHPPPSFRLAYTPGLRTPHAGGCGQAYSTLIVSPEFNGLSSLKRHRIVNAALKDEIAAIHAWTAKCQTPEEWERHKADAAPPLDGTTQGRVEGTAG